MLRQQVFGHGDKIQHPTARALPMEGVALGSAAHGQDMEELLSPGSGEGERPEQVMENRAGSRVTVGVCKGDFQKARGSRQVVLRLPECLPDWRLQKTLESPAASKPRAATSSQSTAGRAERQLQLPAQRLRRVPSTETILTPRRLRDAGVPATSPCKAARVTQPDLCAPTALTGTSSSKPGFDGESKQSSVTSLPLSIPNLNAAVVFNPGDANCPPSEHSPAGWTSHTRSTGRRLLSEGKAMGWGGRSQAGSVPRAYSVVPTPWGWQCP